MIEEDFDRTVAVNLKGTFFLSQAVGRVMIGQGSGRIVMIGSQAGSVALPGESVYCMTKAAVAHLTKCLAVEWGRHGITVNCVAPTFIRTPGSRGVWPTPRSRPRWWSGSPECTGSATRWTSPVRCYTCARRPRRW